ncbi:RNA methylase [Beggiatoa sp. PS]|nr:RNA methylase [Beggiatoa sp. PS]
MFTKSDFKSFITDSLKYKPKKKKSKKSTNFYVFVKQDRDRLIHRKEIAISIATNIENQFARWHFIEPADIELWAFYISEIVYVGLRLTDISFRQRQYKAVERAGSLRPTIAIALVIASNPTSSDIFIDPMCGVGTIAIERLRFGNATKVYAGDSDESAVTIAQGNVKQSNLPIVIYQWNANDLQTLKNKVGKVNKLVCNLPFGKQFKVSTNFQDFYFNLLIPWREILLPDGMMVLLTTQTKALVSAAKKSTTFYKMCGQSKCTGLRGEYIST